MGKGASRRLRRETGKIPAIVFGGADKTPQSLSLVHKDLYKSLEDERFFSSVLTLNIDGNEEKVILKDLQRHPAKPLVLHADFLRVSDDSKIKITIPLHFINENKCAALKLGGTASHSMNQVEITCLPQHLPECLEIDMSSVEAGQIVHLSDINMPEGVEISALLLGTDHDQAIANITGKRAE
jgi:large subunit ribosomal protein L25